MSNVSVGSSKSGSSSLVLSGGSVTAPSSVGEPVVVSTASVSDAVSSGFRVSQQWFVREW